MGKDFESEFEDIINNNDFSKIETDQEEQEIALEEAVHVLECINETAMLLSGAISEALETKTVLSIPQAAVSIFRALHDLHEEFVTAITVECDCEDCVAEETEEDDGTF